MKINTRAIQIVLVALVSLLAIFSFIYLQKETLVSNTAKIPLPQWKDVNPKLIYGVGTSVQSLFHEGKTGSGLPKILYKKRFVQHPVALAEKILAFYGEGIGDDPRRLEIFRNMVLGLVSDQNLLDDTGKLFYGFSFTAGKYQHQFKTGWGSAMAQGLILLIAAKAYKHFPNLRNTITDFAEHIMDPLEIPISQNGLMAEVLFSGKHFIFYPEYPVTPNPPLTLNGFMYTLIGLHEWKEASGSRRAADFVLKGIATLKAILPLYNTYPISVYDLAHITIEGTHPNRSGKYHQVHINLLRYIIEKIQPDPLFVCIRSNFLKRNFVNTGVVNYSPFYLFQDCTEYYVFSKEDYLTPSISFYPKSY